MTRRAVLLALAASTAVAGAAWCFERAIVPGRLAVIVLPCAVIPPALAAVFRNVAGSRWTALYAVVATVVGYIVIDLAAGVGLSDIGQFRAGIEGGLTRLFSTTLPIVDNPQALIGVGSFIWLASTVTCWLASSEQRAGLSLFPPAVVALVGLLAGIHGVGRTWAGPTAWVAGSALLLAAIAAQTRWPAPRIAFGQILAVVAAMGLVVIGSGGLPQRTDAIGVDREEPPVLDRLLSPLDLARVLHQDDFAQRPILSVRSDTPTDAIRIATLDSYNGSKWSVGSTFTSTDRRVGPVAETAATKVDVTIFGLASAFVPAPSNPVSVDGVDGLRFDNSTRTLRSDVGVSPRDTYNVRSSLPLEVDETALSVSVPAFDEEAQRALGRVVVENRTSLSILDQWIKRNAPTELPPAYRLSAIGSYLSNKANRVDEKVPRPGASLSAVLGLATVGDGALVATEAQFATLFCVLADRAGFPCRVAVGFRNEDDRVPAGLVKFLGRDAHVWPEVRLAAAGRSIGWVPFVAAPSNSPSAPDVTTTTLGSNGSGGGNQSSIPDSPPTSIDRTTSSTGESASYGLAWWLALVAIVVVLVAALLLVPLIRLRQGERRLSGSGTRRVIGAWLLVLDALDAAGESSNIMGSEAVAARVTALCSVEVGAACRELAHIVLPVLYGGVDSASPESADRAVALARRCSESIMATLASSQRRRVAFRRPQHREQV